MTVLYPNPCYSLGCVIKRLHCMLRISLQLSRSTIINVFMKELGFTSPRKRELVTCNLLYSKCSKILNNDCPLKS